MNESAAQADQQENPSVYDFLYIDAKRVGAFLTQFDLPGVPQSVKQAVAVEDTSGSENKIDGSVGLKGFASAGGGSKDAVSVVVKDATEQVFDPIWVNAISLLTHLEQRNLLGREFGEARIGQFCIATGFLGILDYSMMKLLWQLPALRDLAATRIAENIAEPEGIFIKKVAAPKQQQNEARKGAQKQAESILDMASFMPHTLQARLTTRDGFNIFATLAETGLAGTPADFALKHGILVPGTWSILGVVDAFPDDPSRDPIAQAVELGVLSGDFAPLIASLIPFVRQFGRPSNAFGMTPLLIFRQVGVVTAD